MTPCRGTLVGVVLLAAALVAEAAPPAPDCPLVGSTQDCGFAGPATDGARPYWRRNLFKRVGGDQLFLFKTWWPHEVRDPRFSIPAVAILAAAGGSASGHGGLDLEIQREFAESTSGSGQGVARAFSTLGNADTAAALVGATWLAAHWTGHGRLQRTASLSAEALIDAGIYSTVLKEAFRRTRPAAGGTGQFFVGNPPAGQQATSFPSGHATGAFAVAAIVASEYHEHRWVRWTAYGVASLIAASRVALGRHFPTDVAAGALIGRSLGRAVATRSGVEDGPVPTHAWGAAIDPERRAVAVTWAYAW